jgi:hypothetical protein
VWLVIGASDPSPAGIARVAKGLAGKAPGGLVFQTRDCGDQRNVFGFALAVADSADSAKATLQSARATVKDAYIKRCGVVPRSLLDLRFPAVESSIANVPDDAVNWEDSDRVSSAINLPDMGQEGSGSVRTRMPPSYSVLTRTPCRPGQSPDPLGRLCARRAGSLWLRRKSL